MGTSMTTGSSQTVPDNAAPVFFCANHPERETVLRCNRCEKPICFDCAVLTEVGYRCKECVRGQQAKYYNGEPLDPVIGVVFGLILGGVAGVAAFLFLGIFGFFFGFLIALFAGPAAGGIIAEAVRVGVKRRRTRYLSIFVIVAALAAMFLVGLFFLGPRAYANLLPALLFAAGMASTIYARLL
jgi:hypothetical protein